MSPRSRTRLLGFFGLLALGSAALYLFYAPMPPPPPGSVSAEVIELGGRSRRYLLHAPPSAPTRPGLLLVFHPSQSSGEVMRRMVGPLLEAEADRRGLLVVYPDGFEGHFNDCRKVASYPARKLAIEDVGLSQAIVARLEAERGLDPSRVYALGFSNGGQMVLRLALEAPRLLRGGIVVGANLPATENMDCKAAERPTSRMVFIAGTRDPISSFGGGRVTLFGFGDRGLVRSTKASGEWFAERLGLVSGTGHELDPGRGGPGHEQEWFGSTGRVRVVSLEGAGHTVPQASYRFPRMFGATVRSDAVIVSALEMLERED